MRLEKHTAVVAFHSQLSAILEKLMVLAVEEIKELVFDFCEEISQEKTQNKDLYERTREDQGESVYHSSDSFYIETQDDHNEPQDQMSPTNSREDAKEKLFPNTFSNHDPENMPTNCKFEQVATVSKNPSTIEQKEDCSHEESRQSNFEPPEDNKKHLIDYNSPDESQCTTYDEDISTNQDHSRDVEFHIKQEEETPGFETGNCTRFQMQTGQMVTEAQPTAQDFLLVNQASYDPPYNVAFASLDIPRPAHTFPYVHKNWNKPSNGNTQTLPQISKVFKCEYCNKMYRFPSLLKAHYMKHTQDKQLACRYCGKLFKWEYSLRRHERSYCGKY
ncbi:hypothetical protein NQD34_000489 [Periophthalmus magnuspinnatus]|uniref:zinc finger protein 91-like isoform X3 n=1 Tax=Periophthalmus magnuspinnatus TaxID=409849 RepID=UPI00145B1B70|nr:zinc finger protein 91-like isoform X3 [Periophthalmus magnuspinnatus]KAJ0033382.1 hypothetical protein NQD34_000489 [Periophthalmus magnuspinnatus]